MTKNAPSPTIRLERLDHRRNISRFYRLSIEPTLFGGVALVREWGRIGTMVADVSISLTRTAQPAVPSIAHYAIR